nr:uncharacterized protein LOC114825120 [Malus domestica]
MEKFLVQKDWIRLWFIDLEGMVNGVGSKSPEVKKSEEEAEKWAEAATQKSEARRLADLEEKELEKEQQEALEKKSDEVKKKQSRTVEKEEYERMVVVENKNRDDSFRRLKASFKIQNRIVLVCIE